MARKTATITIDEEGRDRGKCFYILEMPALAAEKWAYRALLAVGRSGGEVPDELQGGGMAAIAAFGIRSLTKIHRYQNIVAPIPTKASTEKAGRKSRIIFHGNYYQRSHFESRL